MKEYKTAEIEVVNLDTDVIMTSVTAKVDISQRVISFTTYGYTDWYQEYT